MMYHWIRLIRTVKTNSFLQFAVLTGCLRVSKESIFTGLNNFKVLSITDARFDEQFGFTEKKVKGLLKAYHLEEHLAETKEWYDGYHFGDTEVIERYLNRILGNSISVFDIKVSEVEKENAYHTLLVGLLAGNSDGLVNQT